MTRRLFLGHALDEVTTEEALSLARDSIRARRICMHASVNASMVVAMAHDPALASAIAQADIVTADGQSIVWAARLLGMHVPERVPAIDLMTQLLDLAARENYGVYFLGSTNEVLADLIGSVSRWHPLLRVSGYHNGFYAEVDEADLIQRIRQADPEMLFVGMSSPRKELFMASHRAALGVPFIMGVGGAFEVLAGHRKRAPAFAQRHGLEWLFRMFQEPRRLWRRYLIGNGVFAWMVFVELWRSSRAGK